MLNFLYAHLKRVIFDRDNDMIYICGPGQGSPGMVANTRLVSHRRAHYGHHRSLQPDAGA